MILGMRKAIAAGLMVCLAILLSPALTAAGDLTGTITDKGGGATLAGATIVVKSADPSAKPVVTAADRFGQFKVSNIPSGEYTVTVSSLGFAVNTIAGVTVAESGEKSIAVTLTPSAVNLDAVSVTASRRPEKIVNSPASVSVVQSENIEARTTLTATDHIKGLPAVDVASTGLNQSNAVVRGFNNIFSGSLLVLTDNRIARVPSLRFNAYNFIPTINEDLERIEIVSGPGSALYGPNAASGVMHMVTKSPFSSQGTTVSIGGGDRDLMLGSIRHAGTFGDRVGYKITGQYYEGHDWETRDSSEPAYIQKFRPTADGPEPVGELIPNNRDYDISKLAGEGRLDFLIDKNMKLILNGGISRASSIELTGLGAAQAVDWIYSFAQTRFRYKNLFAQGFVNMSDAGDSYLLSTGQLIVDRSKLWGAQVQHRYEANDKLSFTYGLDALLTRPETEATINGSNELEDNIDEFGVYLQSDIVLTDQLKFVGAARFDDHNKLEDPVFSPRAALVYQPDEKHNFRATYNRAFSTPDNNSLYLDILQTRDVADLGAAFGIPEMDIRVQGVPESGFHWSYGDEGPNFYSTFAPLGGMETTDQIPFNDPFFTNVMWGAGRGAVMSGLQDQLTQLVAVGMIDQPTADGIAAALDAVTPGTISGVNNTLMTLDPDIQRYVPSAMDNIADIDRLEPTITQTFELGYKGVVNDRLRFSVDVYRTEKDNFIGPLTVETPNVFLDPATLQAYLAGEFTVALNDPANAGHAAYLAGLDAVVGDGDGDPVPELTQIFTSGAAQIPFGTVTPDEAFDPTAILVTYRNFGDINFYGADFSFAYHLDQNWNFGGMYSYISKNFFEKSNTQVHDIHLNSPKHKVGFHLQYVNPKWGLDAQTRYRFIDAFDMDSPFFGSSVKAYHLVDMNVGVKFIYDTRLALTVQNVFDREHVEFIGGPEMGRLAIMRLTRSF
jgi:iron complex outermembrane receptor protein